jgi:hypothetical protein
LEGIMSEAAPEATTEATANGQTAEQTTAEQTAAQTTEAAQAAEAKTYGEAYVKQLRDEAATNRTKARDAETAAQAKINAILEAAGIKSKDEPLDPAKLTEQLTAKDDTIRTLTIERALDKAARKAGADEDLLDAVLTRKGSLKELDPSDKDFTKKLDALVKAELDANPKLKATQAAAASGSDFTGGSGEGAITKAKFDAMTPAEKNALYHSNPTVYRQHAGR